MRSWSARTILSLVISLSIAFAMPSSVGELPNWFSELVRSEVVHIQKHTPSLTSLVKSASPSPLDLPTAGLLSMWEGVQRGCYDTTSLISERITPAALTSFREIADAILPTNLPLDKVLTSAPENFRNVANIVTQDLSYSSTQLITLAKRTLAEPVNTLISSWRTMTTPMFGPKTVVETGLVKWYPPSPETSSESKLALIPITTNIRSTNVKGESSSLVLATSEFATCPVVNTNTQLMLPRSLKQALLSATLKMSAWLQPGIVWLANRSQPVWSRALYTPYAPVQLAMNFLSETLSTSVSDFCQLLATI